MILSTVPLQKLGRCVYACHQTVQTHRSVQGAPRLPEFIIRVRHPDPDHASKIYFNLHVKCVQPLILPYAIADLVYQVPEDIPYVSSTYPDRSAAVRWLEVTPYSEDI